MKNFLKNHLLYTVITSIICFSILLSVKLNSEINIILLSIACGILNSLLFKLVLFSKNIENKKTEFLQRETYISTLNHDLKIPTLAQIQALQLLANEKVGKINKRQKEIVNLTLESCTYMYQMLSTILSTYKYENNDIYLCYEKVHVSKLIDECFDKSIQTLENKNLKVRVKAKENFLTIPADRIQIKKAFENIIEYCVSNADEDSEIICEIKQQNKNMFLSLCFNSPYLTATNIQNRLNKYPTSSEKFDKVGSGLELYLAKQIINAHNGSISVESVKSTHNIYNIELPCINECKHSATKNLFGYN